MKRIEREWNNVKAKLVKTGCLNSRQLAQCRLMFYAGMAGAANIMIEAERSSNGAKIIEEFGKELTEANEKEF